MSLHLNTLSRPWNKQWSTMYRDVVYGPLIELLFILSLSKQEYIVFRSFICLSALSINYCSETRNWNWMKVLRGLWNCASHHFFWTFLFLLYVLFVCLFFFFCSFPYLTLDFHIVVIRVYERVHYTGLKLLWHYRVIHMQCYGIVM